MSTYEIRDDILPPTRQPAPNKRRSPETKLAAKQAAMAALGMEYSTRRIGDPIDVEQTIRRIKACIEKGDKAAERANDLYVTAGQHLLSLKQQHDAAKGTWAQWEELLKKVGIGKSRASELMQIADGRKTVTEVRALTGDRTRKSRESSPLRSGEKATGQGITAGQAVITADERKAQHAADEEEQSKPKRSAPPLNSLSWSAATPQERIKFIDAIGLRSLWQAMTSEQQDQFCDIIDAAVDAQEASRAA